ncbi:flippase [Methylophaga sp.]|uniref:flippase n=1 Tax=Methylophaga sp. TaxID=2024840 RepID=UPI003A945875
MFAKLKTLQNHPGFIRYFKNTSWMMGEQFLRIIAGLFVGIWVARYLGPEQFGLFNYMLAFTALFGGIAKLGLDGIMVRDLVNHPEKSVTYLGTAFWLKFIGAIIVMGLIAAIAPFISNDTTTNQFIFIIAAGLVFQSFEVVEFDFQSQVLAKIVSICKVIQLSLSSIIKIYLVLTEAGLFWFVLVTALDAVSLAISYLIAYNIRKKQAFYKHFDFNLAKQLLRDSWPMIFGSSLLMIQAYIDQVMIQWLHGSVEVGYYSVAIKLIAVFGFVPIILKDSLFPAIVNAKNKSSSLYTTRILNYYRLNFMLFLLFAIPVFMFSEIIVVFLFGDTYRPAGVLFALLAFRLFFSNMGVARGAFLLNENLLKFSLITLFVGALVNIVLNYLWIPEYAAKGAVAATIVSFTVTIFLMDFFYKKTRNNAYLMVKGILTFYRINLGVDNDAK